MKPKDPDSPNPALIVSLESHGLTEAQRVMAYLMTERELQENVIQLAELLGCLVYHTHDSRRSEPGFPDLVIAARRGIVYAELKRQGRKLTPDQENWRRAIEATSTRGRHEYHLWRPTDWHSGEIEDVLRRIA